MVETRQLSHGVRVRIQRLPEFTSVMITGPASMNDYETLITSVGEESRRLGDKRMLVDQLGIEGTLRFTDHFQIGELVARHLRHLEKMASVVPGEKITHTSEKVALQQGMQLRVFTTITEAVRWLAEPPLDAPVAP
jgi:hypothetical protein